MSIEEPKLSQQERFDGLAYRIRKIADEESMGSFSRMIEVGQVATRFLVFAPRPGQNEGYSPIIQLQDLSEAQAHEGIFWAPFAGWDLRRNKLDGEGIDEKLSKIELGLDIFEKILDFRAEAGS